MLTKGIVMNTLKVLQDRDFLTTKRVNKTDKVTYRKFAFKIKQTNSLGDFILTDNEDEHNR